MSTTREQLAIALKCIAYYKELSTYNDEAHEALEETTKDLDTTVLLLASVYRSNSKKGDKTLEEIEIEYRRLLNPAVTEEDIKDYPHNTLTTKDKPKVNHKMHKV